LDDPVLLKMTESRFRPYMTFCSNLRLKNENSSQVGVPKSTFYFFSDASDQRN
jgi:hypothetical protein